MVHVTLFPGHLESLIPHFAKFKTRFKRKESYEKGLHVPNDNKF